MDAFATLGMPRRSAVTEEQVRAAYFAAAKVADADQAALNAAFELLLMPDKRLKHLLEIAGPPEAAKWRTVTMGEGMMALFSSIGQVRPSAEALIEKRTRATSALSKALTERQAFALADEVESIGLSLEEARRALEADLPALDEALSQEGDAPWIRLAEVQAHFAYLAKWQAQVREMLMRLRQ